METEDSDATLPDSAVPDGTSSSRSPALAIALQWVFFGLHLAAVYLIVNYGSLFIAGWTRNTLLPVLGHKPTTSTFEFFYSHLLAFSFLPAFMAGFANAKFRHRVAQVVWIVPLAVLIFKIATFPHTRSVLYQTPWLSDALSHYFNWNYSIPEYHSYRELFQLRGTPDMHRGFDQWWFTAPFYAGLGYSLASFLCLRWNRSLPDVVESVEHWHRDTRLEPEKPEAEVLEAEKPESGKSITLG